MLPKTHLSIRCDISLLDKFSLSASEDAEDEDELLSSSSLSEPELSLELSDELEEEFDSSTGV